MVSTWSNDLFWSEKSSAAALVRLGATEERLESFATVLEIKADTLTIAIE